MPVTLRLVRVLLLTVTAAFMSAAVSARDKNGQFAVKGVGALRCAAYLQAAEGDRQELAQYSGYLAGYVSAYNEHRSGTFDLLPWQSMETLMLLMLRHCQRQPDASFAAAATEMAQYFEPHRLARREQQVRLGVGNEAITLHASVVDRVREALAQREYPTDDLYASLQQFRRDQQLPEALDNLQTALLRLLHGKAKP